jgi:hypothetical protein
MFEPCQKTYPESAIPWWEAVSTVSGAGNHTQRHRAAQLGEPQVLLYSVTKFTVCCIQIRISYMLMCSIPKAPLFVWPCIALAFYKATWVVWSEFGYSGVPRDFFQGVQQIKLRTERTGNLGRQPLSQGFCSICKWVKPVFLLGCYRCIFHRTGNSARLCQTSEFWWVGFEAPPSVRHCLDTSLYCSGIEQHLAGLQH